MQLLQLRLHVVTTAGRENEVGNRFKYGLFTDKQSYNCKADLLERRWSNTTAKKRLSQLRFEFDSSSIRAFDKK
jgi:hypothetical protein